MRILYLSNPITSVFGGGEKLIDLLTSELVHDEHVFLGSSRALHELFRAKGLRAVFSRAGFEPVSVRNLLLFPLSLIMGLVQVLRFRELYRTAGVLVAPTSFSEPFFVFPWARLLLRRKTVFLFQNARLPRSMRWGPLRALLNACLRESRLVLISAEQAAEFTRLGLALDRARVIESGVPVAALEPTKQVDETAAPTAACLGARPLRLGFCSRLHAEKGLDILFGALRSAELPSDRRLELLIAGEGPAEASLRRDLEDRPLPANVAVSWLGFVFDTGAFFRTIDLLVLPTRREALPLVMLEAWERGVPVLTSDLAVLRRIKAKTGLAAEEALVFRAGDARDLGRKIAAFLSAFDTFARADHGRRLHRAVETHFDFHATARSYAELFHSAARPLAGMER